MERLFLNRETAYETVGDEEGKWIKYPSYIRQIMPDMTTAGRGQCVEDLLVPLLKYASQPGAHKLMRIINVN